MYDARAIANFLLDYADERDVSVTLLWILKVIYFAHGWHLSQRRSPLIEQNFEAWEYGPVVRSVYDCFKGNGDSPLTTRALRFDVIAGTHREIDDTIQSNDRELLRNVFDAFVGMSAFELSDSTHTSGSPWEQIWNAPNGLVNVGMKIPNEVIQRWFSDNRIATISH